MKRWFFASALILAACSEQPVGQSAYFDPWENPQVPQSSGQTSNAQALGAQMIAAEQGRVGSTDDAALVASLEAAIQTAGNDVSQGAPSQVAPMPTVVPTAQTAPAPQQPVQVAEGSPLVEPAPAPTPTGTGQISDNSFESVTATQSIESDAARLAALQQSTVVLEAEPLPQRNDGINLAAFARSTTHKIGERLYKRSFRGSASAACRKYGNPDAAQRAFLAAGGPENDPLKIDPDGDGFVCGWSPVPFRNLRANG